MAAAAAATGAPEVASALRGATGSKASMANKATRSKESLPGLTSSRFYEAEYPQLDDIVVVQVRRVVDMGAYATLLEYGGKEGMMLLSELSKRRIRSVSKLLRVGRTEICTTLRVDKEKGYIDLSKRRVEPERATAKEEEFAKAKAVHSIMLNVASQNGIEVEELCKKISWPLFKKHQDAYTALKRHVEGEIDLWSELDFSLPGQDLSGSAEKLKAGIEESMRRRLGQQVVRLRAKVEVWCPEYDGIEAVKEALRSGLEASSPNSELRINLVAHPVFAISCTCRERTMGVSSIDRAMGYIEKSIKAKGGYFRMRSHPDLDAELSDEEEDDEDDGDEGDGHSLSEDHEEAMPELDEAQMKELEHLSGARSLG